MRVRWRKLRGDLGAARGRVAVMVVALAVSLAGFGTVLGARAVLQREITASYLGSRPADATLELPGGVDAALVAMVRARPEIAAAAAREVVMARVQGGQPLGAHVAALGVPRAASQPLELFVADDLDTRAVTVVRRMSGAWPPPAGTMALERTAVPVIGAREGDTVTVTTPHGAPAAITVTGVVHDAALAPAWQEHRGYAYITRATLAALGEPAVLHELGVRFAPPPATQDAAEAAATALAGWLAGTGHAVHQLRVPPLRRHPHLGQMAAAQLVLLVFGVLLLVLSAVLVATLLAALLARQVREIGVLKAVGARTAQLAAIYAGFVLMISCAALAIALPLAALGAHAFVAAIATMLNLAITDPAIPGWVAAVEIAAGLGVPLALAARPILGACRRSVRDALASHGAREHVRAWPRWLPKSARNALRTPGRLALSMSLLVAGGVLAITAYDVKRGYEHNMDRLPAMWRYDVDFWLTRPAPVGVARALAELPGVRTVEPWGDSSAAWPRAGGAGQIDLVHTYPDQGHGRFHVFGAPPDTTLAQLPLVAGRWLTAHDTDAIVMSRGPSIWLGQRIQLSLDGQLAGWTVVGIVDPLPPGSAFVRDAALAAVTHTTGQASLLRVAFAPGADAAETTAALTQALAQAGVAVDTIEPFALLHGALDDHVLVVSRVVLVLACILALVGLLGLAAAISIRVLERTRELGVLKALGAGHGDIQRLILGEALVIGLASWAAAAALAVPMTAAMAQLLGAHGLLGVTLVISPLAIAAWLAIVMLGSAVACWLPARRAARLTVREALAEA